MKVDSILWRRIDVVGHDACRLEKTGDGWRLSGTSVFRHELGPASLAYELTCDERWITREGSVRGWVGEKCVDRRVQRAVDGTWTLNGARVEVLDGCAHLDFGFTPATNLPQLRAMALRVGEAAELTVAWIDVPDVAPQALQALLQRYARTSEHDYAYESPSFGYAETLVTNADGFVSVYPKLWEEAK